MVVEDCGHDDSWERIRELAGTDPGARELKLKRNYGRPAAVVTGLSEVRSGWSVIIDSDLQAPLPELNGSRHGTG